MATSAARMRFSASVFLSIARFQSIARVSFLPMQTGENYAGRLEGGGQKGENIPDRC